MSPGRLAALGRAMALGFVRDRSSLFFTVLFPLFFLFLFGGVIGNRSGLSRFDVLVTGSGPVIDGLPAEVLKATPVDSLDEGIKQVSDGKAVAVIAQDGDRVTVRYQASDQVGGATVLGVVASVVDQANLRAAGATERFAVEARQVEDESLTGIEFFTPGLLGWAVSIGAVFNSALTLVNWRAKGVLLRLRLTPAPVAEILVARVAVSLAIALLQTALFLAVGAGLFHLHLAANWWMAFPLVMVGTLAFLSIGLLVGSIARTVESASALANLIVVPMAFVSGAFFPLDQAPAWLRLLSKLLPLSHLLRALTDEMIRGRSPAATLPDVGILLGFAVVFTLVATRLFRWDKT